MLTNAQWISQKQIRPARVKNGKIRADEFPDMRDMWTPLNSPPAFEAVILKDGEPTDKELTDAISTQFGLVLRRQPESDELTKYLPLAREAVRVGGNTEGLRQVLVAVLLESEFLYRYEFGDGPTDNSGRRMLSPREGAFAISYALGDRSPDLKLLESAANGHLNSREDYRREVTRLLADSDYYSGEVDSSLNCGKYNSIRSSHPRIMRFFRDFFAYPLALKVFKDSKRSDGKYANPDRGYMGTPGWLTVEADRIVALHVENDRDVFHKLLTFDEFFVYHNKDNETGKTIIDEWRSVYERLKNTAWKTHPDQVINEYLDFLKSRKSLQFKDASKPGELLAYMRYFEESFGQGRTPFTTHPWAHGYTLHHSPFYNLPPTPDIGRYGNWRTTKYNDKLAPKQFWDYPTQQPFRIPNRMGILTHPAWLIAGCAKNC